MPGFLESLIVRLAEPRNRLRAYEQACLDKTLEMLQPQQAQTVRAQVSRVRKVQRIIHDKEVGLIYGKLDDSWDAPRFKNRAADLCFAVGRIQDLENNNYGVRLSLAYGVFHEIAFDRNPNNLNAGIRDLSIELTGDPDRIPIRQQPLKAHGSGLIVESLRAVRKLSDVLPPEDPRVVQRWLSSLSCPPPRDLIDLLAETDGFRIGGWEFVGVAAELNTRDHMMYF